MTCKKSVHAVADVLPEGLTRELPSADEYNNSALGAHSTDTDDLEVLRRQLEAIYSA